MDVLERPIRAIPAGPPLAPPAEIDEAAARRSLRTQIAKLEADLGAVACSAYPRVDLSPVTTAHAGPRLLGLGELERVRDELATRIADVRDMLARQASEHEAKRVLIERMLIEPGRYKWVRVTNADIGEPGCKEWHVRPKLGPVGLLCGWWRVKISAGCPLAGGRWPRPADGQAIT